VIHGDIKPGNICIPRKDKPVLIDWESAKQIGIPSPTINGTLCFSSPDSLLRRPPSPRDDLFSLAYTIIYLCSNQRLPWLEMAENITSNTDLVAAREQCRRLAFFMDTFSTATLCRGLPTVYQDFLAYVRSLNADSIPAYDEWSQKFQLKVRHGPGCL
jgi:serine/threonine protein kinase